MNEQKTLTILLGATCLVLVVVLVLMAFNYIPTMHQTEEPELVNVGLGAYDLGKDYPTNRALRLNGFVCNVGEETAYKTRLHVVAHYVTGSVAIDTYIDIGNGGRIYGSDAAKVETDIPYSAASELGSWTLTPVWSRTP